MSKALLEFPEVSKNSQKHVAQIKQHTDYFADFTALQVVSQGMLVLFHYNLICAVGR